MKSSKMISVVLGIFILKFQGSVSQFPSHMDFQKVGDVIFNNEKYNILKPTVHVITDYFKDHMLRRENKDPPGTRIFIDHNGFRHTWSGFGKKTKSLRKTDLDRMDGTVEDTDVIENDVETNADVEIETATVANSSEDYNQNNDTNEQQGNKSSEENKGDSAGASHEIKKTTTTLNIFRVALGKNSNIEGIKHKVRNIRNRKPMRPIIKIATRNKKPEPKKDPKDGKERTVAKTTFFCPFLGIVSMSAFID